MALLILAAIPMDASGQPVTPPNIGLGYGPTSVQPISQGVPVYSRGDNMWLESYYNATIDVTLVSPQGTAKTGFVAVDPGQLFELYSFKSTDPSGNWTLSVTTLLGVNDVTVFLVPPDSSLKPTFSGARLEGNLLNQTFALPRTDAYDIEICTEGQNVASNFGFSLGGLNGSLTVSLLNDSAVFSAYGIPSPLSAWLELYSQYTYEISGGGKSSPGSLIFSQDLLVASTPVISLYPPEALNQSVAFLQQMPIRQGRFDLRVFDRTASGLALHDAQLLRTAGGAWIPLGGCTSRASAFSSELSVTTDLNSANSTWPRQLLTMYSMSGVESYTEIPVPRGEAAVHFRTYPDGGPLTGVSFTASMAGLASSDWDVASSSVYLMTSGLPGLLSIRLSFSGIVFETVNVTVAGPYSSKTLSMAAGTLTVSATQQGKTLANATISVGAQGSPPVAIKTGAPGSSSILLPPGNYSVSASYSGVSSSRSASVTPGHISSVSLDLTQQSVPVLLYALIALGAGGVAVNIFLWRQYLERRKVYG